MQGVRAPTEKMSRSLSFSRPCYSGLLSVGLVALLLGVDHAFARFVDVIRNDISLPEDVDAGDAKPADIDGDGDICLLYTSPSPRDRQKSRMPSSA